MGIASVAKSLQGFPHPSQCALQISLNGSKFQCQHDIGVARKFQNQCHHRLRICRKGQQVQPAWARMPM
ncbi:MAG: hypothetical protein CL955_09210 [Erythrobacteraceae bacterium]|nr:hypothetical protein [Erythrobacteraceae bacterium]